MDSELIVESLEEAGELGGDLTSRVYRRLFDRHPEMEALFVRDVSGAVKGEMLMKVIEAILDFIGGRAYSAHLIQCEVVTHEGYGVPPDVFGVFFGIVRDTVREVLGPAWTGPMEGAWRRLLADLDHYVTHPEQVAPAGAA